MTDLEFERRLQKLADSMTPGVPYVCKSWVPGEQGSADNIFYAYHILPTLSDTRLNGGGKASAMRMANDLWIEAHK